MAGTLLNSKKSSCAYIRQVYIRVKRYFGCLGLRMKAIKTISKIIKVFLLVEKRLSFESFLLRMIVAGSKQLSL